MDMTSSELSVRECAEEITVFPFRPDRNALSAAPAETMSFLDLVADCERHPTSDNRSDIIARYQAWIEANSAASTALYGGWFNLGVELAAAGDKAGAINAYHNALVLRPGFYPAAINLGTLLESEGQPESALATWQQALQPEEARTALLDCRSRLVEACRIKQQKMAKVLHVGCAGGHEELPPMFRGADWREIRLDIDPAVHFDFVACMNDKWVVSDGLADAVYTSHTIKHLCPHEVQLALQAMHLALKPTGIAVITLPDLQEVARYIAEGKLEDPLYISPAGPITPLDILYGHRPLGTDGNEVVTPHTGFTGATLGAALIKAGFAAVLVQREPAAFSLTAIAFRSTPDKERLAKVQARMLPAAGDTGVLYTPSG